MDTSTLLKTIGGQAAIARECDISDSAVSQWAADDEIPKARKQYLQVVHPGPHWAEHDKYLADKAKPVQQPANAAPVATETVAGA